MHHCRLPSSTSRRRPTYMYIDVITFIYNVYVHKGQGPRYIYGFHLCDSDCSISSKIWCMLQYVDCLIHEHIEIMAAPINGVGSALSTAVLAFLLCLHMQCVSVCMFVYMFWSASVWQPSAIAHPRPHATATFTLDFDPHLYTFWCLSYWVSPFSQPARRQMVELTAHKTYWTT